MRGLRVPSRTRFGMTPLPRRRAVQRDHLVGGQRTIINGDFVESPLEVRVTVAPTADEELADSGWDGRLGLPDDFRRPIAVQ